MAFRFLVSKSSFLLFFYWFFLERREEEETLRLKSVGVLLRQSRCWRPFLSCVYLFDRVSCCERSRYFLVPCLSSQSANSFNRCIIASSIRTTSSPSFSFLGPSYYFFLPFFFDYWKLLLLMFIYDSYQSWSTEHHNDRQFFSSFSLASKIGENARKIAWPLWNSWRQYGKKILVVTM